MPEDNGKQNPVDSYTNKYQKHAACSYGYKLVCVDDSFIKLFKSYLVEDALREKCSDMKFFLVRMFQYSHVKIWTRKNFLPGYFLHGDTVYNFVNSMIQESKYCNDVMKKYFIKELVMTKKDNEDFENSSNVLFVMPMLMVMKTKSFCA